MRTFGLAVWAVALGACASTTTREAPRSYVLVSVHELPDAPQQHLVEAKVFSCPAGSTDAFRVGRTAAGGFSEDGASWRIVGDDIRVLPGATILAAPSIVAADGERATVSIGDTILLPEKSYFAGVRFETTVTPAGGGAVDLALRLENRGQDAVRGHDVVLDEIPQTTIRLGDGQSALIPTRRSGDLLR